MPLAAQLPRQTVNRTPTANFVFEGSNCIYGNSMPNCVYVDQRVTKPNTYTYRVYALWANTTTPGGPLVSPPSPPATVQYRQTAKGSRTP